MTGSVLARRVALYVRAGGSNTPRGWLSFAVFSIKCIRLFLAKMELYRGKKRVEERTGLIPGGREKSGAGFLAALGMTEQSVGMTKKWVVNTKNQVEKTEKRQDFSLRSK